MALKSMTGFARRDGADEPFAWAWEARTLNARGFDVRLRLPPGFEAIEARARDLCKSRFVRGNCTVNLAVKRERDTGQLRLNESALRDVAGIVEKARGLIDAEKPSLDALLGLKGVIEFVDEAEEEQAETRYELVLADLAKALDDVAESRAVEGRHLEEAIVSHIEEIEGLVGEIEASPARTPEAIMERLQGQISRLLQDGQDFDQQRLHQEAVLLATKADIAEELDRLRAHIASARNLLKDEGPVGRRFEFLAQEFNREANTICSKSNDGATTTAGLALKAVIDRLREQVQNIE